MNMCRSQLFRPGKRIIDETCDYACSTRQARTASTYGGTGMATDTQTPSGAIGRPAHAARTRSPTVHRLFPPRLCLSATIGPYAQISPKPTKPAPNTAACPPTASHPPDYLWHANSALGVVVCARSGCILHDTTCCHDSSWRATNTLRV